MFNGNVTAIIIVTVVVLLYSALIYGTVILAKMNPEIINGFRWGNTPEEREEDKRKLALGYRTMTLAAVTTPVCALVGALTGNVEAFVALLIAPLVIATLYWVVIMPRHRKRKKADKDWYSENR